MCSTGAESDEEDDEDDGGARPVEITRSRGELTEFAGGEVDEEEEEEGDLELGWKVLEAARLIYNKESKRSLEEVDVMTALADISLEKGNCPYLTIPTSIHNLPLLLVFRAIQHLPIGLSLCPGAAGDPGGPCRPHAGATVSFPLRVV